MTALLEVRDLTMRFGGLLAVDGVSFAVPERRIVSIIGPNGAGKTTVFNCLNGFYRPSSGSVRLDGLPIHGLPGHRIARLGVRVALADERRGDVVAVIKRSLDGNGRKVRPRLS